MSDTDDTLPPLQPTSIVDISVDLDVLFGQILRHLRTTAGHTQAQLADALGWDRSLIVRIEAGRNTPTIHELVALEQLLLANQLIDAPGHLLDLVHKALAVFPALGMRAQVLPRRKAPDLSPFEHQMIAVAVQLAFSKGEHGPEACSTLGSTECLAHTAPSPARPEAEQPIAAQAAF